MTLFHAELVAAALVFFASATVVMRRLGANTAAPIARRRDLRD